MNADANNLDRRRALRRLAGGAGALAVGAGVCRRWPIGTGSATGGADVTLLDARGGSWLTRRPLSGALRVRWQDFSQREPTRRGLLLPDLHESARRLAAIGVRRDRPAVVVGDGPDGWGEEGRLVWMLWYLGVTNAVLLSVEEWEGSGLYRPAGSNSAGEWLPAVDPTLRCAVRDAPPGAVVIDARSREEYLGTTRFGGARGGHVPGALHLAWDAFFDRANGTYDPVSLGAHLESLGVSRDAIIVCYCTGGVRSAYLTVRLRQAGFAHAANDDGGMWSYSASAAPLVTGE